MRSFDKRTAGLMPAQMKRSIERTPATNFPDGIPSFGGFRPTFPYALPLPTRLGRSRIATFKFDPESAFAEGSPEFSEQALERQSLYPDERRRAGAERSGTRTISTRHLAGSAPKLDRTIVEVEQALADYRFDLASKALYEFVWERILRLVRWSCPSRPCFEEAEKANPKLANATRHLPWRRCWKPRCACSTRSFHS